MQVEKNILGTQAAVSLMLLGKNLLLSTLGSQITKDFVWKSKAAIHSFTFNFAKLLYLILWEARANLIIFYRNLHHMKHLSWISQQFFVHHNISRSSGWIRRSNNCSAMQVEKNILGTQAAVSLMVLSKNLFFMKLCSCIKVSWANRVPIALYTLSSNISAPRQKILKKCPGCWDSVYLMFFYKTLLFMTLGFIKKKYENVFLKKGLQKIALCTLSSNISAPRQKIFKKMPRMLRCSVPDVPLQTSAFHDTWLYLKKCIKVCWAAKQPPFSLFLPYFAVRHAPLLFLPCLCDGTALRVLYIEIQICKYTCTAKPAWLLARKLIVSIA